jgi:hypothetical protein
MNQTNGSKPWCPVVHQNMKSLSIGMFGVNSYPYFGEKFSHFDPC